MQSAEPICVERLLPQPKSFRRGKGRFTMSPETRVEIEVDDSRVGRAFERWRSRIRAFAGPSLANSIKLTLDASINKSPDSYRLKVQPQEITIIGGSPAGCFYGLKTLAQLTNFADGAIASCTIEDWPDFSRRGLLHDVTRGKVPKIATLKNLVDRLAALKINQLQLNIEHAFCFAFDPQICDEQHGLTTGEVQQLDAYCQERFITLIPAIATLGHMGYILSMPQYCHLSELAPGKTWSEMTWPERARGLTLNCSDPASATLVENIVSDIAAAFSSPIINICGDEPHDLGKSKSWENASAPKPTQAYIRHLNRLHEVCSRNGKQMQLWSDVVVNHPEYWCDLPKDATILHWGYDDKANYKATHRLVHAGFDTYVCPGTSGWKRILSAISLAERNIQTFASIGLESGASGLLNTDWGDHGHFNPMSCSWHGITFGAACAWNASQPAGREFDRAMSAQTISADRSDNSVLEGLDYLRAMDQIAGASETWRLLWMPMTTAKADTAVPDAENLKALQELARKAGDWWASPGMELCADEMDAREISLACRFLEIFGDKMLLTHSKACVRPRESNQRDEWADRMRVACEDYAICWRERNKESGLNDILFALQNVEGEMRSEMRNIAV